MLGVGGVGAPRAREHERRRMWERRVWGECERADEWDDACGDLNDSVSGRRRGAVSWSLKIPSEEGTQPVRQVDELSGGLADWLAHSLVPRR